MNTADRNQYKNNDSGKGGGVRSTGKNPAVCCADLLRVVLSTTGEITVTAALLHVMSPHQVKLLFAVSSYALVSLRTRRTTKSICISIA